VALLAAAVLAIFSGRVNCAEWAHFDNYSDVRSLHEAGDTLWVATNGGVLFLNVFAGTVVSALTAADGLGDNSVRTFFEEPGRMFVGTDDGLSVCDRTAAGRLRVAPAGRYGSVRDVTFGPSSALYVCTYGRGVARIRDDEVTWITRADSLLDDKVFAAVEIDDRTVYYATSMGLCGWVDSVWVNFQAGSGLPRGEVRDVIRASEAELPTGEPAVDLYVLVAGGGVFRFDGRRARDVSPRQIIRNGAVEAIALANDGTLWAVGRFGGLARQRDGEWTSLGESDSELRAAQWRCVHVGRSGIVYFGAAGGTIAAFDGRELRKISVPSALPGDHIGPMLETERGEKLIACDGYLISTKDDNSGFVVEKDFGSVLAIAVDSSDAPWVAARWGLYRKQAGRWSEIIPDVEPRPRITCIGFDSRGHLWAVDTAGGACRFDGELWVRLAGPGEIADAPLNGLAIDRRDRIWAHTKSGGVFGLDGTPWRRYGLAQIDSAGVVDITTDHQGMPVVLTPSGVWFYGPRGAWRRIETPLRSEIGEYRAIGFDSKGRIYLGTEQGVTLIAGGATSTILPGGGLRGSDVTSILIDRDGFLWVGFRKDGLSRISLEKLW
jgi:ligand-binding sensor domain-containing protein